MSDIQYQGRQARREGSEQRRRSILEAALRIIVREGIRNVRHRAVAKEAVDKTQGRARDFQISHRPSPS